MEGHIDGTGADEVLFESVITISYTGRPFYDSLLIQDNKKYIREITSKNYL